MEDMKVAFIVKTFPKNSETFILDQITGLLDNGIDVDIFAEQSEPIGKIHSEYYTYDIESRITYGLKWNNSKLQRLINFPPFFIKNIFKNPFAVLQSLNVLKYGVYALSLVLFYDIMPFLPSKKYDIIHGQFGPDGVKANILRELGVIKGKIVTTFHGYDISILLNSTHVLRSYKKLFKDGDLFLPVSNYWNNKLLKMGCSPDKIHVHHMGINPAKFNFNALEPKYGRKPLRIISVARLVEKKGIDIGIKAVAHVLGKSIPVTYNIVGNGPLKDELYDLINELDIKNYVRLLGQKSRDETIRELNMADIFIAPSVTDKDGNMEGIPVAIMEAMAMGLIVISSRHSGIPELVSHGVTGFLIKENDVNELSNIIEMIYNNKFDPKLVIIARAIVEKNFNAHIQAKELIKQYKNLLL